MRVAIIGAGLAGTACAYVLKQYGAEPVIYEAGGCLAPGASGNEVGLYNPRLSAERTPEADFYISAFALALRTFQELKDIGWNKCGSLHLMTDGEREKKFLKTAQSWGWPEEHMRLVNGAEVSEISGVDLEHGALWMPEAGSVSPRKLCEAYAEEIEIHFNAKITDLSEVKADAMILACGGGVRDFIDAPLGAMRGQMTIVRENARSNKLKCNLCYGGYFSPALDGVHALGATFERNTPHSEISDADDAENIRKLSEVSSALAENLQVSGRRAAVRTTSKDHFPLIGKAGDNIYVSTGHGSHGILNSLAGAHVLADMILGRGLSLPADTVKKLDPMRFRAG